MPKFSVNQIVKGAVCGTFVVLACKGDFNGSGECWYQIKEIDPVSQRPYPGALALPESRLRLAA